MIIMNKSLEEFYIDLHTCKNIFILLLLFNIVDIIITSMLVDIYGANIEINLLMRWLIIQLGSPWTALTLAKVLPLSLISYILWIKYDSISALHLHRFKYLLLLVTMAYGCLALYQTYLFMLEFTV